MSADYMPSQNSEHLLVSGVQENLRYLQWRRQDFVTGGSEVWVYRGSRVRSPPVPVVLSVYQRGSTALQCISRVIRRSSMTIKAHTYYIIFGRPPIEGGSFSPSPLAAPLVTR